MNCTAGHHCLLYEPYTLYPLDPPWGMDPKPDLSSQPGCPSSSNTPAYLSPANAVSLEEYGGGRTKNGAQLLFPVRDTNPLTVCAKSLLHQWKLCQRTTTTPHARSGKQGPPWAVSRGHCSRVERKEGGIQTLSAFGEDFLRLTSWVPLQGRGENSISHI